MEVLHLIAMILWIVTGGVWAFMYVMARLAGMLSNEISKPTAVLVATIAAAVPFILGLIFEWLSR